jgi:hypothetical protein
MQAQSLFIIQPFPDGKKSLGVVVVRYRLIKNFDVFLALAASGLSVLGYRPIYATDFTLCIDAIKQHVSKTGYNRSNFVSTWCRFHDRPEDPWSFVCEI